MLGLIRESTIINSKSPIIYIISTADLHLACQDESYLKIEESNDDKNTERNSKE